MNHEIRLYGPIGGFSGFTAEEIVGQIPEDAEEVTLRIHSPGGSVGEGLAIYHALRDHKAAITTIVDGYAASSASFLMLAGDVRQVHRNSIVFVHNPWTQGEGDAAELRKIADGLDVHTAAIMDIYKQRTGMDEDDLRDMMDETAFFRGVDAIANGFATEVLDDPEAEAQIAAMLTFEGMAAQVKEIGMSTQKTRKEIEAAATVQAQELDAAKAEIKTLKMAQDDYVKGVQVEHEAALVAKDESRAAVQAELDIANAMINEVNSKVAQLEQAHAELVEVHATLQAESESQGAELVKAQAALKNPAVADAVLGEATAQAQVKIDAEADEAEKKAASESGDDEPKDALEEYEAMEAGHSRQAFYSKNHRQIHALIEQREKQGE